MPFDRPDVLDIPTHARELQARSPIAQVRTPAGDIAWLVTSYRRVRQLLADERLGRSHPDPESAARYSNGLVFGGPVGSYSTERDAHARMRRIATGPFVLERMNRLRPRIQQIVDGLLDEVEHGGSPVDLHEAFSFPLPVLVICDLLGVPYEDHVHFREWSDQMADVWDRSRAAEALDQLHGYVRELVRSKRRTPADDVISILVAAFDRDDRLTEEDGVVMSAGLLFAGHETTIARIDVGILLLLRHPDQVAALSLDPSLVTHAVEEILRMAAPSQGVLPRYAREDIEVGGVTIARGELVLLAIETANRDGSVFPYPDEFDIRRQPNPHVGFGHGYRSCLGAALARVELQSVFGTLFRRLPTLRLAIPADQLRLRSHIVTGGLVELPVSW